METFDLYENRKPIFPTAIPTPDPVIFKLNNGLRYQYRDDGESNAYLVDQWFKVSDAKRAARYNPDLNNVYHLFTRYVLRTTNKISKHVLANRTR